MPSRSWTIWRRFRPASHANAAVEFALVMPVFMLLVLGCVSYGHLFWIHHELQQLTAEAARSAVAGMSDAERDQLARAFVSRNLPAYAVLDGGKLQVSTAASGGATDAFRVDVAYDLSGSLAYKLGNILPLPQPNVQLSAVIQRGGY